jgi:hypothetical protein
MKNFPTRAPVGMLLGSVLGVLSMVPIGVVCRHYQPPLERFYFPQYLGSTLAQTPIGTVISFLHARRTTRSYFVFLQDGRPVTSPACFDPARHISVRFVETTPRIFATWLQQQIYGGHSFRNIVRLPIVLSLAMFFSFFLAGVVYDGLRRKRAREGVTLRGPDLMTRRAFNRITKGKGFTLHVHE